MTGSMRRSKAIACVEERFGKPLSEVLMDLYIQENLTLAETAARLGVDITTVWRWKWRLGIPAKRFRSPSSRSGRKGGKLAGE